MSIVDELRVRMGASLSERSDIARVLDRVAVMEAFVDGIVEDALEREITIKLEVPLGSVLRLVRDRK